MNSFWRYRVDHLLFWGLTVFFHVYTRQHLLESAGWFHFLLEIILRNTLLAIVIYGNLQILVPRLLQKKEYVLYLFAFFGLLAMYVLAKGIHDVYLFGYVLGDEIKQAFFAHFFYNLSIATFYVAFSAALHLSKEWYFQRETIRKIEIEKLNAELNYLKSQINPHFLFNSINTIYFQIDKNNIMARETLSRFSDMLRYQLYECNGRFIPVEKEIHYLRSYVSLQRLRKNENYSIAFTCGDYVKDFDIAPLLLIPFVENAFTHISHFSDSLNEIKININRMGDTFTLNVYNTHEQKSSTDIEYTGIGLSNVKRRLELIYPNEHHLDIKQSDSGYEVVLELRISKRSH